MAHVSILTNYPILLLGVTCVALSLAAWIGARVLGKWSPIKAHARHDFGVVLASVLTILGLLIGFSFSMAISRYDSRKICEEAEANAIGTEYLRADLLARPDAAKVRSLLAQYLQQRVLYYSIHDDVQIKRIDERTSELSNELWAAVVPASAAQPTPVVALAVSGMNDVLNSQGYTQAAWLNRLPEGAWILIMVIAVGTTLLVGYGVEDPKVNAGLLLVLPFVLAVTFALIADIDSPRGGMIRVVPQNLDSLAATLHPD
jgi:hypothetical protein